MNYPKSNLSLSIDTYFFDNAIINGKMYKKSNFQKKADYTKFHFHCYVRFK